MFRGWRWLSILTVMGLIFVGLGTVAAAGPSEEQGFLSKINAERSAAGLAPLTLDTGLRSFARNHTQWMIQNCDPDAKFSDCNPHSKDLTKAATGWTKLGENVGRGQTVDSLHDAFMKSAGHKKNILLPEWNYVGIGADKGPDGRLYVTVVFMQKGSSGGGGGGSTTSTTKPQTPATTKATTTTSTSTTTTLPPTTTTTMVVGPDKPVTPGGSCVLVTRFGWICKD